LTTLGIIPLYLREEREAQIAHKTIETFLKTAPESELMIVDDCSPNEDLAFQLQQNFHLGVNWHYNEENSGFSHTVNYGLRICRDKGWNALLINSDIEFIQTGYIERMEARSEWVVGAQLLYPNGFIQHAGIFYSVIRREFDHIYRMAPMGLNAAQIERRCPVTGALQFIRHECLMEVGVYDEDFRMGYEDVDYCQRVFIAGQECVYDPEIVAIHHEGLIRMNTDNQRLIQWQADSWHYLHKKWAGHDFSSYVPTLISELDADGSPS
jgi:GT2 family glycosyltransferase